MLSAWRSSKEVQPKTSQNFGDALVMTPKGSFEKIKETSSSQGGDLGTLHTEATTEK
jgi:hypothetical protein